MSQNSAARFQAVPCPQNEVHGGQQISDHSVSELASPAGRLGSKKDSRSTNQLSCHKVGHVVTNDN
jgi:hypothetical protein